jgi:predicted aspartyl protease
MVLRLLWILMLIVLTAPCAHAGGNYRVGRDGKGTYLETDKGESWYINQKDLKYFTVGEQGPYSVGRDSKGAYIKAGKHRKFYVDQVSDAQAEQEIKAFQKAQKTTKKNKHETRVTVVGNQVLVPVTIQSDTRKIEVLLLLDTGASITVLHRDVADKLKLKPFKKGLAQVVGGSTIPMAVAKVKLMETGGVRKKNLHAGIIDYQGAKASHQGLLGMDFLQGMKYNIDYQKQIIQWKP